MKTEEKKLTGAEHAKLNKRKKFYEKLIRLNEKPLILISMNKNLTFPEFNELSRVFEENFVKYEDDIDLDKTPSIEIVYIEEAHFLVNAVKSKILKVCRKETFVDDDGNDRKGISGADDSYNYQAAFNWGIQTGKSKKLKDLLEKELEEPTEYDLTPTMAVIQEPIYRKSHKWVRNRKKR